MICTLSCRSLVVVSMVFVIGSLPESIWAAEPPPVPPEHAAQMKQGLDVFKKHVRQLLVEQCLDCHGGKKTRGDFDLSDRKPLVESGFVGKDAKTSKLLELLRHTREPFMPHKAAKLSDEAIGQVAKWIDLGAPYDKPLVEKKVEGPKPLIVTEQDRQFWSFLPLEARPLPKVQDAAWGRTPVDAFVLAKLEEKKLKPNEAADRRVLIRRAYFDLLGLPPTPAEVDAFVHDPDSRAYDKLIDKLLESKHYGERWARHWMDLARFAESHGYEQDYDRPHAYHYRDFLIRAFNDDMPFDRFLRWQLAGDELAPDNPLAMMATGFMGGGAFPTQLTEAEFESARYDELDDMANTTSLTFLGLSLGCARCHDHKYDPIPNFDYTRMTAAFAFTIRSEVRLVVEEGKPPVPVQVTSESFRHTKHHADDRGFPHFYPKVFHLNRGDVHQKKDEAQSSFLQVLMRDGKSESHWKVDPPPGWKWTSFRRAALANWLADTERGAGHLVARVIVNRLWQHHFGRGIVASPNDFGIQGERPTHPELLDYLAHDLVQNGWKLKRLHKLLVTSSVYLQSSRFDRDRAQLDPDNLLHWRRTPRRLEAEPIRDAMLHVGGVLDTTMYGPGSLDANMRRRSVYFFIKRSQLIPAMVLFDWPEHLVSIGQRSRTTVAPQALAFMNGPQTRLVAEAFAKRLEGKNDAEAIKLAYEMAFGRPPSDREAKLTAEFVQRQAATYEKAGKPSASQLARIDFCQALFAANEFVYVD